MLNLNLESAVLFELFPRVVSTADKPEVQYPDMNGHLGHAYHLEGYLVINEETGQKYLDIKVTDDFSGGIRYGRLFRDPLIPGGRHYAGFLHCQESNPNGFTPKQWQIELSAIVEVGLHPDNSYIRGRAYYPRDAAKHSFNETMREIGIAF